MAARRAHWWDVGGFVFLALGGLASAACFVVGILEKNREEMMFIDKCSDFENDLRTAWRAHQQQLPQMTDRVTGQVTSPADYITNTLQRMDEHQKERRGEINKDDV